MPADEPGRMPRRTALVGVAVPVTLKLYSKITHADTVAALSLPARGRAPTLADIEAFVRQPDLKVQAAFAAAAVGNA